MQFDTWIEDGTALAPTVDDAGSLPLQDWKNLLQRGFGTPFSIFDGATGVATETTEDAAFWDRYSLDELCRDVARREQPAFLADEDPLLVLGLPLFDHNGNCLVATATFVTRIVTSETELVAAAATLNIAPSRLLAWAVAQQPWPADVLLRTAELVQSNVRANNRIEVLRRETNSLSKCLSATYEELGLLYRLTQNLKLSQNDEELGQTVLHWLSEVVPAESLAIQLMPQPGAKAIDSSAARRRTVFLTSGNCPLDSLEFSRLVRHWSPETINRPIVINHASETSPLHHTPVRQMVLLPLSQGEHFFGWLAALNHTEDGSFGNVELNLLSAVATILGIHGGNIELYRQQSELVKGVVHAFTSAIDAKDPSTCGHSDRVAQITVRLAEELGCDAKTRDKLYLAGLLHDVGKIGIDDNILRKRGRLTPEEYEHVKQHVAIGCRILKGLAKLEHVLPVVMHHHEAWDGSGYPHQLSDQNIPLAARIVAVADAFDAMSSDRPYRDALPEERVDAILRAGAGQQWDPAVVGAYFRCRDDLRRPRRNVPSLGRDS